MRLHLVPLINRTQLKFFWPLPVLIILLATDTTTQLWLANLRCFAGDVLVGVVKPFGRLGLVTLTAALLWLGGWIAHSPKLQRAGRLILLSVLLSSAIVMIVKPLCGRMEGLPGPQVSNAKSSNWQERIDERWGRFPSGDSTMAFATASTLAMEFPPAAVLFYVLAGLVGLGRVYVHAHLTSDVFAAAWLGWAAARLVYRRCAFSSTLAANDTT